MCPCVCVCVTIMKVYIARNNTIPYKFGTLLTFETLKWEYTFAISVLILTRVESPRAGRFAIASERMASDLETTPKHIFVLHVVARRSSSTYRACYRTELCADFPFIIALSSLLGLSPTMLIKYGPNLPGVEH